MEPAARKATRDALSMPAKCAGGAGGAPDMLRRRDGANQHKTLDKRDQGPRTHLENGPRVRERELVAGDLALGVGTRPPAHGGVGVVADESRLEELVVVVHAITHDLNSRAPSSRRIYSGAHPPAYLFARTTGRSAVRPAHALLRLGGQCEDAIDRLVSRSIGCAFSVSIALLRSVCVFHNALLVKGVLSGSGPFGCLQELVQRS